MIVLSQLILITTIWCLGVKIVTAEGMLLEKLGKWAEDKVERGHKIYEAIVTCQWCLPSLHSIIGYSFAIGIGVIAEFEWKLVFMYPIVVCGSSILCGFTWTFLELINSIKEYFKNLNA